VAIVGVTVQDADEGETTTSRETLIEAAEQAEAVQSVDYRFTRIRHTSLRRECEHGELRRRIDVNAQPLGR
jgi:hypothetical protein